jgi:hypothetical protein
MLSVRREKCWDITSIRWRHFLPNPSLFIRHPTIRCIWSSVVKTASHHHHLSTHIPRRKRLQLRIAAFLDSVHRPENTTFRELDLLPFSGEGRETPTLLGRLERGNLNHWTTSRNLLILSVTHHRHDPLHSTSLQLVKKLNGLSELCRIRDHCLWKLVPTFADRGCKVVSVTGFPTAEF